MPAEATSVLSDVTKYSSLCSAPVQLREGIHTYMSLAKTNPHLHPAVLAAILARPPQERRTLLEAARFSGEQKLGVRQARSARSYADTLSSSSDEVWEDAVEDLHAANVIKSEPVDMATVVEGGGDAAHLQRLEREAAEHHRAWQETRQLGAWTRYTECRKKLAEVRGRQRREARDEAERAQQESKWSQLEALREVHERRLAELNRRRERLRLSRQYHEQTRLHHAQLAQAQLQDQLRQLEERQQRRRLQHLQRVQQLVDELAAGDRGDTPAKAKVAAAKPTPSSTAAPEDEFTHVWDDFSHWEKMVSDDKENVDPVAPARKAACTGSAMAFGNQPDLIPVMPSSNVWRHKTVGGQHSSPHGGRRHSIAADGDGFEERKKWFEQALLSWHAQDDDEEDLGTSLYSTAAAMRPAHGLGGYESPWHHAAWPAWTGPATSTY